MSNFTTYDFESAFQSRLACCRALLELARQQSTRIAADEHPELLELLNSKQALIEHLTRLTNEQQPLLQAWPLQRDTFAADDRLRCERLLADTETLLAALLQEENSSSRALISRRDATQRELQTLSLGVQAQEAYVSRSQPTLSRFDVNL